MREALKLENARLSSRAEFDKGPEKRLEAQSTVVQTLRAPQVWRNHRRGSVK